MRYKKRYFWILTTGEIRPIHAQDFYKEINKQKSNKLMVNVTAKSIWIAKGRKTFYFGYNQLDALRKLMNLHCVFKGDKDKI